jgi:hypothetical protein
MALCRLTAFTAIFGILSLSSADAEAMTICTAVADAATVANQVLAEGVSAGIKRDSRRFCGLFEHRLMAYPRFYPRP